MKTAEFSAAKKLSGTGTTEPRYLRTSSGCLLHRLRERAEDDPVLLELLLEGGGDRDAVEDGVDRDAREPLLLVERDAELLVGASQLGVDLVEALELAFVLGAE